MLATLPPPARTLQASAAAYRQVGVTSGVGSATPHRLVLMLLDGFDEVLVQAAGALQAGNVPRKCQALERALRIVDEGLTASLNLADGGALATRLRELYGYVSLRLLHANLHNDADAIAECRRLLHPVREAWAAIAPQAAAAGGAAR